MINYYQWHKILNHGIEVDNEEILIHFQIKYAKYEKPGLVKTSNNKTHLDQNQRKDLLLGLKNNDASIQDTFWMWKGKKIYSQLNKYCITYEFKAFKINHAYVTVAKKDVDRLYGLGIIGKWGNG